MPTHAHLGKSYEVDALFHGPLVRLCLSGPEQRCLLKKLGVAPDGLSRCDRHETLAQALSGGSAAPVLRLLHTKYERRAVPLRELPEDAFVRAWLDAFAAGDGRAELWAAATRPLSDGARRALSGRLRAALSGLIGEGAPPGADTPHPRRMADLERDNARLRGEVAAAEALLMEQEHVQAGLRARVRKLERRLERMPTEWFAAERDAPPCDTAHCNERCPSFDLCRKRVLIVGGIERMETLYRKLVEERGGVLEYHAGHMRGGAKRLEKSLQRADLVLCPVNCNSHGACALVKNLAKKYRKPVHMMPNFSLSAVAGVIGGHAAHASSAA